MSVGQRLAYGMLGAPLAMAALPVYVYAPKLYGDEFGLGLALTGIILLLSRAVDTLQDPWLGRLADRLQRRAGGFCRKSANVPPSSNRARSPLACPIRRSFLFWKRTSKPQACRLSIHLMPLSVHIQSAGWPRPYAAYLKRAFTSL